MGKTSTVVKLDAEWQPPLLPPHGKKQGAIENVNRVETSNYVVVAPASGLLKVSQFYVLQDGAQVS